MRGTLTTLLLGGLLAWPCVVHAQERAQEARRIPVPELFWAISQLIPSPEIAISDGQVHAGMRWQITPLSLSWGVDQKPLRWFLVEPAARHAGSFEVFASPEFLGGASPGTDWMARAGGRFYFPLWQRGENLSCSLGGSYYFASDHQGVSAEVGFYTLYGVLGLLVTYSPGFDRRALITTLNIRYF
jgi:hypothetical protein